jgi:hypothetical protein
MEVLSRLARIRARASEVTDDAPSCIELQIPESLPALKLLLVLVLYPILADHHALAIKVGGERWRGQLLGGDLSHVPQHVPRRLPEQVPAARTHLEIEAGELGSTFF